jgi:phosphoglycerate dehydrogenase-like enzyme
MAQPLSILVQTDDPEQVPGLIRARHPDARITLAESYDAYTEAVRRADPDVAFTMVLERRPYPREALFGAPRLRWVHVAGAGVNHLVPWDAGRVTVTNIGGVQDEGMAQFAMARLIAMAGNFFRYHDQQGQHVWKVHDNLRSHGGVLTVIGLGRIGQACARLARAIGMTVYGVRARPQPCPDVEKVVAPEDMHEVLALSDWVIVVTPLTEATRGLVDAAAFAAMKPGVLVHNMARGHVMDEAALLSALRSGHVRAASLDVFAQEPLPADSPLWDEPNVHITPHMGGLLTYADYNARSTQVFLDNLERFLKGEPLLNVCDPVRGY